MRRIVSFTAKEIGAYEDDALIVGFARDSSDEESDDALILQRAKEEDEDDDGIYTEIPIQRFVCYGGVQEAVLTRDSFSIIFSSSVVEEMGGIAAMQISFTISETEFSNLEATLTRIFHDHEAFAVRRG